MNNRYAYLMARLTIAASMFGHGLVRLPKLAGFSKWMLGNFEKSFLPTALVMPFSYALPVAEFAIGLLLLLGLFTKQALLAGGLVMVILIFGSTTIEDWAAIPTQLIHAAFFAVLLALLQHNYFALDKVFRK